MFELVDANLEKEMDKSLHYVARKLEESGRNSKPVLLHSFKISMTLYSYGYDKDIVIAAILHDLIEDTNTTKKDIEEEYGEKIANIVEAVSFNPNIEDKLLQAQNMFENCIRYGKDALLVKCSDLLDNINFVYLDDKEIEQKLLQKYHLFIKMSKEYIGNEKIYKELVNKIEKTL